MHYTASALVVIVALASLVLVIPNTNSAFACSCIPPRTPTESLYESATVFAGEVVDISENEDVGEQYGYKVKFDFERSWKGDSVETLTVLTGYGGGDCGYGFEIGEKYLVYAYSSKGSLNANICSRTTPLANAQEDLDALGVEWKIIKANADNDVFKIPYRFVNGDLGSIEIDPDFTSIIASIESSDDGTIIITIPRNLIDAKTGGGSDDDEFIVLVDGEEESAEETSKSPCFRTLLISVPGGAEEIEIIASSIYGGSYTEVPPIYVNAWRDTRGLVISGCTNLALDDKEVILEAVNPEGELYQTISVTPNRDGSFSTSLFVEDTHASYTVKATYADHTYTYVPEFPVNLMIIAAIGLIGVLIAARWRGNILLR
jgi:hypothetical protein